VQVEDAGEHPGLARVSWPPARAWAMRMRSSSGVAPSSLAAFGSTLMTRSSAFDARLSSVMNGRITALKISSGRAIRSAVRSAWTIE